MGMKWKRSKDGAIWGVCKGLANALEIPVGLFRIIWLISILFFGAGLWLYVVLTLSLPREDRLVTALDPRLLGVCTKISLRTDLEIGIVRFLAIALAFLSFGATFVGYIVLYFVLDNSKNDQGTGISPANPPLTK